MYILFLINKEWHSIFSNSLIRTRITLFYTEICNMPSFIKIHNLNLGRRQTKFQNLFLKPAIPLPNPYRIRNKHSFLTEIKPTGAWKRTKPTETMPPEFEPESSAKNHDTIPGGIPEFRSAKCVSSLHSWLLSTLNKSHRGWERAGQHWYWVVRAISLNGSKDSYTRVERESRWCCEAPPGLSET